MATLLAQLDAYIRAANYLTVAQLYLRDNTLLKRPLTADDIKPRLLGHWGTCPGINFTYAHLNRFIRTERAETLFVLGPGHGFPALQANLFLEETLGLYYPRATHTEKGIAYLAKSFSWPGGFPSHTNPGTPGAILEGGELGYSLATAYGAALDNPNLIVACMIGDGEAETGALAASWQLVRYIDPATNGAVLPILHLNGAKISQPTTFGRMSDNDIRAYFTGNGYEPFIVDGEDDELHRQMIIALNSSYKTIRRIQAAARRNPNDGPWHLPVIILKTPKGWTGIKKLQGEQIEGTFRAHQIVAPHAKNNEEERKALEDWLSSYRFNELFDPSTGFADEIQDLLPSNNLRMGRNRHAFGGPEVMDPLKLAASKEFTVTIESPGTINSSAMRQVGEFLVETFRLNAKTKNFRFFSPDETVSNKLDAIFNVTNRAYAAGKPKPSDSHLAPDGRSLEILSEQALQGVLQGYTLTGRHGVFTSYEAFAPIVTSMLDQYVKFLKVAKETRWRGGVPSLTYLLTSSGWRQEHNGFSHQNPGFIDDLLRRHASFVRVYLPPDSTSTLATIQGCLNSTNGVNVIVAGKTDEPTWLNAKEAAIALRQNITTWDFASDKAPDLIFLGIGDYMVKESLAAMQLLRQSLPDIRLRFVNIIELAALAEERGERGPLDGIETHLTTNKPIIANFHGYPETLQQLLFNQKLDPKRIHIHGYREQGSTTTPFDMHVRNATSRFHLAIEAVNILTEVNRVPRTAAERAIGSYKEILKQHAAYIIEHGVDLPEIQEWQWRN